MRTAITAQAEDAGARAIPSLSRSQLASTEVLRSKQLLQQFPGNRPWFDVRLRQQIADRKARLTVQKLLNPKPRTHSHRARLHGSAVPLKELPHAALTQ